MDKKRVSQIKEQFDLVIHSDQAAHIECWYARDLMTLLGYERWENFDKAIGRAIESCETSGIEVSDHFREITKMIFPADAMHDHFTGISPGRRTMCRPIFICAKK